MKKIDIEKEYCKFISRISIGFLVIFIAMIYLFLIK